MICVDASLAAKWIFPEEPFSAQAEALYQDTIGGAKRVVAPPLLPIEVTNIIRQRMRRGKAPEESLLSLPRAQEALDLFQAFSVELIMPSELHQKALQLAATHDLSAVYDAHYVALAQLLDCPFWTADQKLTNTLRSKLSFIEWIGNYHST